MLSIFRSWYPVTLMRRHYDRILKLFIVTKDGKIQLLLDDKMGER